MPPVDENEQPTDGAAPEGERPSSTPPPDATPRQRARWRRVVNRRSLMWTAIVGVVAALALALIIFILYRSGRVDRYVSDQIVGTFAKYGIRAEIEGFETQVGARTAVLTNLVLYDQATGEKLGEIDRLVAKVRIEDMYALSLNREVSLEELTVDGLEAWVTFDAEGRSNFRNIKLPAPEPNKRILFSYSTAHVRLNNAVIHYGDKRYDITGEARNINASVRPEDPNAPEESRMNLIDLALSNSTFTYNGRPVNDISVELKARANQQRADISQLVLRSPVAEARLTGALDDWRALRYRMKVEGSVDLTQVSDVLQAETTMRGSGRFNGTVTGEAENYNAEVAFESDALAADGVRLKALQVTAKGKGAGSSYEAQGRAVAELLTAGDFQLNMVQVAGGVMGTGTDFRWIGDLSAAAARSGEMSIAGLILKDATAEMRDGQMKGGAKSFSAGTIVAEGARVSGAQGSGVTFERAEGGATDVTAASVRANSVVAEGTTIKGVQASGLRARVNPDESATVSVERLQVAGVDNPQARTGSLNIAGVRLSVSPGGVVEGTSGDVNVGTVALRDGGRAENVRLARPRFTLEPAGRYRASADLSLGGGVLGEMRLGAVRGAVVASNDRIQLNDFVADIYNGRARGDATISTSARGASTVRATFEGVDVGGVAALASGRAVPLTGAATGTVNLSFPGTNFKAASGTLDARFSGETGREETARTPLTGELALTADRGLFRISRASLRTGATELNASGQFSFAGGTDLAVNLNSTDAGELQRVVLSTGLLPNIEENARELGLELAGDLRFDGTLKGDLDNPLVNGHVELGSLALRGRDIGALSADIASDTTGTRINNGRLRQGYGGGAQFTAVIPREGENNISFDATLENVNTGNLVAALGGGVKGFNVENLAGLGPASGQVTVRGFPGAMEGSANLRVAAGRIGTQPYEEIAARATFSGSKVNIESVEARLPAGRVTAAGTVDIEARSFDIRAEGKDVRLDLVTELFGARPGLPRLGGLADFTATAAAADLFDPTSFRVELNAQGRDVTVNGQPAGVLTLTGRTTADQKFNVELTTGLLGRPQVLRAQIDFGSEDLAATFETTLTATDLTPLFAALLNNPNVRVSGTATGKITASGNLLGEEGESLFAGLRGRAEFDELVVEVEDVQLTAAKPLVVLFTPAQVTFEKTRFTGAGTDIVFGGSYALAAGATNSLTVNGSLNLRVVKLSPNDFLTGTAAVNVGVTGAHDDPKITGTATLTNASFATLITDERLQATNINGVVRFNADQARIESLTGRLGGGRFSISGGVRLAGFRPEQFRFIVRGEAVTVPLPQEIRATADADLEIQGSLEANIIKGRVNVRRAEYTQDIDLADLLDRRREAVISEGAGGGMLAGRTTLDLNIQGREALVVRNNLADIVGSLSVRVSGPLDDPVITGRVTAERGTLAFRNDRYEIQRAIVDLPPRRGADPVVNIQAEAEIRGYRVIVGITGPLSQPVTSLRSDPALPQADVVALITTGSLSTGTESASTVAQTGLGTATSLLTDTLINAPISRATDKLFGLNRFEFDPLIAGRGGASPTARLTVGRQINRNLAVTFSTNVTGEPNQVVAVEYRVSDRLSFVAQYQQGAQDTLRARDNNFNFELRFRKRY